MIESKLIRKPFLGGASAREIVKHLVSARQDEGNRDYYITQALAEAQALAAALDEFAKNNGLHAPVDFK